MGNRFLIKIIKKFLENFKKSIDNTRNACYNIVTAKVNTPNTKGRNDMAYAVYYRRKGDTAFKRASEIVTATKGKMKGTNVAKDLRFETIEAAEEKASRYHDKGYETKIKEVK